MDVETVNIDELISPDYNPRHITPAAMESLKQSIDEFGYIDPLIVNRVNMHVVGGNQRLECLKALDYEEVEVIFIEEPDINREKAINIRLNNSSGDWDIGKLDEVFQDLELDGFDLTLTGFATENLQPFETETTSEIPTSEIITSDLNTGLKPLPSAGQPETTNDNEIEITEDNFEKTKETKTTIQYGDLFQLGDHKLLCGDSTNENDVSTLMGGGQGQLLFTSPPYADLRDYHTDKNNLNLNNIVKFISTYKNYVKYQCVNLGLIYRNNEVYQYWNEYINYAKQQGLKLLSWNVWDKIYAGSIGPQQRMFPLCHEWIFVFGTEPLDINRTMPKKEENVNVNKKETLRRNKDGNTYMTGIGDTSNPYKKMGTVITQLYECGNIRHQHPATFPVKLPSEYIKAMTNQGDIVIDCFGGSGTTLIACEQLNRKARLMELSPEYCQVIINRWEQYTGQKAVKIN